MRERIASHLRDLLSEGAFEIGQIAVRPGFLLSHVDDVGRIGLMEVTDPQAAADIALEDDAGKYRPLKTAPNLKHGWRLVLPEVNQVLLALDFLYPAAVGTAELFARKSMYAVDLKQTLARQTGMYAVAGKIADHEAYELVAEFCGKGCLRKILWRISPEQPLESTPLKSSLPLLCAEACNLFVARAREVVKNRKA